MLTYKNDPKFKEYVSNVESLIPELSKTEINLLKKYYKNGIEYEDAVCDMLDFGSKEKEEKRR